MDNEKNGMNMDTEQVRQFFTVALEQAVTKVVEQAVTKEFERVVNPKFDEHLRRMDEHLRRMDEHIHKMDEQNLNLDQLRIDMRIAISESNPDRLEGTITIPSLTKGFGGASASKKDAS